MKWSILVFTLLVLASCQGKEPNLDPTLNGFFPEDTGEVRKPAQFAELMAASGARSDATLSNYHFDGPGLNSLGEEKLSLMLKSGEAPAPLTVYLNVDQKGATTRQRESAVVMFLKDKGLAEGQIAVVYGVNPAEWSPAAKPITKLKKTETGDDTNGGGASDSLSGAPGSGAGASAGGAGTGGGGLFTDTK